MKRRPSVAFSLRGMNMKPKWVSKLIEFLDIHGVIVFITHFLFPIAVIIVGGMIGGLIGSYFFK